MQIANGIDEDDRSTIIRTKIRDLMYEPIGTTSNEKYLAKQAKTDVDCRIKCRWDASISERMNGVRIGNTDFDIVRIYENLPAREMELSLEYVE